MIYVNKTEVSESDFVSLLGKTKINVESEFKKNGTPKNISGVDFENIIYSKMVDSAVNSGFEGFIEQTSVHAFPDIVAKKLYGVEVKMTIGDKWISTGNSVLETTRIEDIKTIFMFFGKFGNNFEIRYRKYQECLYEVGVTHSPRYKIDMELEKGKSIFNKIGIEYDVFRKDPNAIKQLKEYYRKQLKDGEELWWIDSLAGAEETSVSPVIKSLKLLDKNTKEKFINEVFVLFPEIFGSSTVKFERAAAYLITEYNAVSSNLRDAFTAGGQVNIKIKSKNKKVSKLLYKLSLRAPQIKVTIQNISKDRLSYYWNKKITGDPLIEWKKLVTEHSKDAVIIFEENSKA